MYLVEDAPGISFKTISILLSTSSILFLTPVTLSSTTLTLSSTLCVSLRICAAAIRASSCVNLSNLFNASSMSFLPTSFLKYFAGHRLADSHTSVHQHGETHWLNPASSPSSQLRRC